MALPYPLGLSADDTHPLEEGNNFIHGMFQTIEESGSGFKRSFDASVVEMISYNKDPFSTETISSIWIAFPNFSDVMGILGPPTLPILQLR
jgi:hypothetical protein